MQQQQQQQGRCAARAAGFPCALARAPAGNLACARPPACPRLQPAARRTHREEHACDILIRTNCYCYSIGRFVGSYCEPGLGATGAKFPLPMHDCGKAVAGIVADGAKPVDRWTVYNRPTGADSHYIALAVKPAEDASDSG